ncbi:MAG: hypothetical protein EXR79_10600 [Myxococcales bacterium]|nr:hypothetical protein [Myxococcales bacterium]
MIRSTARARTFLALPLLAGLAAFGCAAAADDLFEGACRQDADCTAIAQGLVCWEQQVCVAATVPTTDVVLRLQPPATSGLLAEPFRVTLSDATLREPFKLVLTAPAVVRGIVTRANDPLTLIPGTLIATVPGGAAGQELAFSADSLALPKHNAKGEPYGFELRTQPGHAYDLAFWPQSDAIPPHYASITIGGSLDGWKIGLPAEGQLHRVRGRIEHAGGPIADLRVWFEDTHGRQCSTHADTDSGGAFELKVDPTTPEASLRFEPAPGNAHLPRGRLYKPMQLPPVAGPQPIELGVLHLGALPADLGVTIVVQDAKGKAVAGALVRVQRALAAPVAVQADRQLGALYVEQHGLSDANGRFTAQVPAGQATIVVVPGPKSDVGRWTWKGSLKAGETLATCPQRPVVAGDVADYAGRVVGNARVSLRRVGPPETDSPVPGSGDLGADEPIEAVTTAAGTFFVPADPGQYAVWVLPPSGAGLARMLTKVIDVKTGTALTKVNVQLLPPVALAGRVLGPGGVPVAAVVIDVLAEKPAAALQAAQRERDKQRGGRKPASEGNGAASKAPGDRGTPGVVRESHLLASCVSNAAGAFQALVAPGQVSK